MTNPNKLSADRLIYLEPTWKFHSLYVDLVRLPPQGYRFIYPRPLLDRGVERIAWARWSHPLHWALSRGLPLTLLKSMADYVLRHRPPGALLTFACEHAVFRDEPWITDVGHPLNFAGGDQSRFEWYARFLRHRFESSNCKAILCWTPSIRDLFLRVFGSPSVLSKTHVVPVAVAPKRFEKRFRDDRIRLLFVNSANIPGQFDVKGGKETIEAFLRLRHRYPNLDLVVRSDMDEEYKRRYAGIENLHVIDRVIPQEDLARLFEEADIFVIPSSTGVIISILEAMSYELPVVARSVYHVPEIIDHGKTGILLTRTNYSMSTLKLADMPLDPLHPRAIAAARGVAYDLVDEMVDALRKLIEDRELRREMGRRARAEVESGRFSITRRNALLAQIFDGALA